MKDDVLIVGAGPAGAIAALVLARAGLRVRLIDRTAFPRDKLCGDSLNPGAMALLARHGLAAAIEARGLPMDGMLVTGPGGAAVTGTYPEGLVGRSLTRRDLDLELVEAAARAGASVECGHRVIGPLLDGSSSARRVVGIALATRSGRVEERRAPIVIAADGRHSTIAFGLGLAHHPLRPRRWAIGAYFEDVRGLGRRGEMHVRPGAYIGVAPVPGGLTNVCLVVPAARARQAMRAPAIVLDAVLACDEGLRERFRTAKRVTGLRVLGPLAVDARAAGMSGLLLAGDAAGFVDPMTGDGMRIAMRGAELAASAALQALDGLDQAHLRLAENRAREFGTKLRVNRVLRALVARPVALSCAAAGARLMPALVQQMIAYAGDVNVTSSAPPACAAAAI